MDIKMKSWEFIIENGPTADYMVNMYNQVRSAGGEVKTFLDLDVAISYNAPRTKEPFLYEKMKISNFLINKLEYTGNNSFYIKGRCNVDVKNSRPPFALEERDFVAHYNTGIKKGTITFLF